MDISLLTSKMAVGGANIFPDGARHHLLDADDLVRLKGLGITHLLSVREYGEEAPFEQFGMTHLWIPTENAYEHINAAWLRRIIDYAESAFAGGKLYLYCNEGLDRSPSAAYGILQWQKRPPEDAIQIIRMARPQVRVPYISLIDAALLELFSSNV